MRKLVNRFIRWACRRAPYRQGVITFGGDFLFYRFEFLRPDEWPDSLWDAYKEQYPKRPHALLWWFPFNAFVHCWRPVKNTREALHDHPRWSITVCLRGKLIEHTPWNQRTLTPGSIVFRTRKAIHAFEVPAGYRGKTWTLFIVGRRKHAQHAFRVVPR